jgi:hypothetical protein
MFIPSSSIFISSSAFGGSHYLYYDPLFALPKLCLSNFFNFLYFTLNPLFIDYPHSILFSISWIFYFCVYLSYFKCCIFSSFLRTSLFSSLIYYFFILALSEFNIISSPSCSLINVSKAFWYKTISFRKSLLINACKNYWSHF